MRNHGREMDRRGGDRYKAKCASLPGMAEMHSAAEWEIDEMSMRDVFVQLSFRCRHLESDDDRCDACGDVIYFRGIGIFSVVNDTELRRGPVCVLCASCADVAELDVDQEASR